MRRFLLWQVMQAQIRIQCDLVAAIEAWRVTSALKPALIGVAPDGTDALTEDSGSCVCLPRCCVRIPWDYPGPQLCLKMVKRPEKRCRNVP